MCGNVSRSLYFYYKGNHGIFQGEITGFLKTVRKSLHGYGGGKAVAGERGPKRIPGKPQKEKGGKFPSFNRSIVTSGTYQKRMTRIRSSRYNA